MGRTAYLRVGPSTLSAPVRGLRGRRRLVVEGDLLAAEVGLDGLPFGHELLADDHALAQDGPSRHHELLLEQRDGDRAVRQYLDLARVALADGHALVPDVLDLPGEALAHDLGHRLPSQPDGAAS